jgi:hypothetical protein
LPPTGGASMFTDPHLLVTELIHAAPGIEVLARIAHRALAKTASRISQVGIYQALGDIRRPIS